MGEIRLTDTVWPDIAKLDDREALVADLFDWVEMGPPCNGRRELLGAVTYEDVTPGGLKVQYFIGTTPKAYVGVLRVRKVEPPLPS